IILWLAGVLLRVWRLARFFQIEGYDNRRFLRWLTARVERYVVARALIFVGLAFAVTLLIELIGQDSTGVYFAIWTVCGVLAIWPEPVKEVKQAFKLTQRAARLLIAAFALAIVILVGAVVLASSLFSMSVKEEFAVYTLIGLAVFQLSP